MSSQGVFPRITEMAVERTASLMKNSLPRSRMTGRSMNGIQPSRLLFLRGLVEITIDLQESVLRLKV